MEIDKFLLSNGLHQLSTEAVDKWLNNFAECMALFTAKLTAAQRLFFHQSVKSHIFRGVKKMYVTVVLTELN